jgi:hypothetical protein
MPFYTQDLGSRTLENVLQQQIDNCAWRKQIRGKIGSLVNSRLANDRVDPE